MSKLRTAYPNALAIERIWSTGSAARLDPGQDHRKIDIQKLYAGFYEDMTGSPLDDEALNLLASEIAAIELAGREVVA